MSRRDWNRPTYRRQGRDTENINGGDFSALLRNTTPRPTQLSKAELRRRGEEAVREFEAKRQRVTDASQRRAESAPGTPPWEHGDDDQKAT